MCMLGTRKAHLGCLVANGASTNDCTNGCVNYYTCNYTISVSKSLWIFFVLLYIIHMCTHIHAQNCCLQLLFV